MHYLHMFDINEKSNNSKVETYHFKVFRNIFFLISLFLFKPVISQNGPGGIGNINGSITLKAWYQANSGVVHDALNKVSAWNNSVNISQMNLIQGTTTNMPDYVGNAINGMPVVSFTGTSASNTNFLITSLNLSADYFPSNASTVIVVSSADNFSQNSLLQATIPFNNSDFSQPRFIIAIPWQNNYYFHLGSGTAAGGFSNSYTTINTFEIWSAYSNTSGKALFKNEALLNSNNSYATFSNHSSYKFSLGNNCTSSAGSVPSPFNGDIAEYILFTERINSAQRIIIDNYLSAKYNITLAANDKYSGHDATFTHDVVGIGEGTDGGHYLSVSGGLYLAENASSLDAGEYIMMGHNYANATIVSTELAAGIDKRWNCSWFLSKPNIMPANTPSNVNIKLSFDLSEGINGGKPGTITNYRLLYRANTSSNFSVVAGASAFLENSDQVCFNVGNADLLAGYYTLGTTDNTNSPLDGTKTWYTYYVDNSDNWDNWNRWTTDPDGSLLINTNQQTPGASDTVVILNGSTMNITSNNKTCAKIDIRSGGTLVLASTVSGTNLGIINGQGKLVLSEDNYPLGNDADFRTKGTVEYRGGGYNLAVARSYCKMVVNLDNASNIIILNSDLTIAGNFDIERGVFQINQDGLNNAKRTINVNGDVTIQSNGQVTTGSGNTFAAAGYTYASPPPLGQFHSIYHEFIIQGNFSNYGVVSFTNLSSPLYNQFATNGAVTVRFTGGNNNTINIYNTANFYNLIIDKGSDQTYVSTLYSSNVNYFNLFGGNALGQATGAGYPAENPEVRKALFIKNGTLKLTGNIYIHSLTEGNIGATIGNFSIGANASLWIAGSGVTVFSTANTLAQAPTGTTWVETGSSHQALSVYGKFRISDGFFGTHNSAGIIFWSDYNGIVQIEGGTLDIAQMRSTLTASGKTTYIQSGGTLNLRGDFTEAGEINNDYPLFALINANDVFSVNGGTINILDIANGTNYGNNAFYIASNQGNYSATGGTVNISVPGNTVFQFYSTSNLWNLNLNNSNATNTVTLRLNRDLAVSNDITLGEATLVDMIASGVTRNLSIGRDLTLGSSGASTSFFTVGTGTGTAANPLNTISFTGSSNSIIDIKNITQTGVFSPLHLTINKVNAENKVSIVSSGRNASVSPMTVLGNFTISTGTFDYGNFIVNVQGNLDNNGTMGVWNTSGRIRLNNTVTTAAQTISSGIGNNIVFGHIDVSRADGTGAINTVQLNSNISCDLFTLSLGRLNLQNYRLSVDTNIIYGYASFSNQRHIYTAADVGARGLRFKMDGNYTANTTVTFPVSSGGTNYYRNEILLSNTVGNISGYLTVIPVALAHPSINTGGGCSYLNYYWRTVKEGMSTATGGVVYDFYYPVGGGGIREYYLFTNDWADDDNSPNDRLSYDANVLNGFKTGEFTGSSNNCFNAVDVFTSIATGNWGTASTWDRGAVPGREDVVIINAGHTVTATSGTQDISSVYIRYGGTLQIGTVAGLAFDRVSGAGKFRMADGNNLPVGDFDEFLLNDTAVFEYYGGTYILPSSLSYYPNLKIGGNAGTVKELPNTTITVRKDLMIYDDTNNGVVLRVTGSNDLYVQDSIKFDNGGVLEFLANTANSRFVQVEKSIDFTVNNNTDANAIRVQSDGASAYTNHHQLIVKENIKMNDNSSLQLYRNKNDKAVDLYFRGGANSEITSSASSGISLNRFYIEKSNNDDTVLISSDFTLTDNTDKALNLATGRFILNNANIDINLTSGANGDFTIPGTGCLTLSSGSIARISGNNDLILNNKLRLLNNSQFIMNEFAGQDNSIVYTASGNAGISVENTAKLLVAGQIRRSVNTEAGTLTFSQGGNSEVLVGDGIASATNRAMFELYPGSSYSFTGGSFVIANSQSNTEAALYLDPTSYTLATGSKIVFGNVNTPAGRTFGIYSAIPLKDIEIAGGTSKTVKTMTLALTIDSLKISVGQTYDANNLNLSLKGNFNNQGTYTPGTNTTQFTGTGQQRLIGAAIFQNILLNKADTLKLFNNITLNGNLTITAGCFYDLGHTVYLKGNLINNNCFYSKNANSGGIEFNGSTRQELSGSGNVGFLNINNTVGVELLNDFQLVGNLLLTEGSLFLRSNQLIMGASSNLAVPSGEIFSKDRMLVTNGSVSDRGVKLEIGAGTISKTIPIGVVGKYTPVTFTSLETGSSGFIDLRPVNAAHPTVEDANNSLNYYWNINTNNFTSIKTQLSLYYDQNDVKVTGLNTESAYIPAYQKSTNLLWAKYGSENINSSNNIISFNFQNGENLFGDFTAAIDSVIPDNVPVFYTIANGTWEASNPALVWAREDLVPVTYYPNGHIVKIRHTINVASNFKSAYKTIIETSGTLNIAATVGHYLGHVSGEGKLSISTARLPAGDYEQFFSCSGGTMEYAGSSYTIPSKGSIYKNLNIIGTGTKTLPASNITVCKNFLINGPAVVNGSQNISLTLNGNFNLQAGSFQTGTTYKLGLQFSGSAAQTIQGNFTGVSELNSITINNAAGVSMSGNITMKNNTNVLTLNNGALTTNSNILKMNLTSTVSPDGGNSNSFVSGPITKSLVNGSTFSFPTGKAGRNGKIKLSNFNLSATSDIKAEYFNTGTPNKTNVGAGILAVSNEYWTVTPPGLATQSARVTLRWDALSDVNGLSAGGMSNIRVVLYNGTQWVEVPATVDAGSTNTNGAITTNAAYVFSGTTPANFALGSAVNLIPSANFVTIDTAICAGTTMNIRINLTSGTQWDLVYNDGTSDISVTVPSSPTVSPYVHSIAISPATTTTYRLVSVRNSLGTIGTVSATQLIVTVNALPADPFAVNGTRCGSGIVLLGATGAGLNEDYRWYDAPVGGALLQNSGANLTTGTITATTNYYVSKYNTVTTCVSPGRSTVVATVNTQPVVTYGANPTVSIGNPVALLLYTINSGTPNVYSISFSQMALDSGFVNVTDAALPAGNISISVPTSPQAGVGTYFANVVVKDALTGCESVSSNVSVGILYSSATIASSSADICLGQSVTLTFTLIGSPNFELTYSDGTTTNTLSGITGLSESIVVTPAVIGTAQYTITSVSDSYGAGVPGSPSSVSINVKRAPQSTPLYRLSNQ